MKGMGKAMPKDDGLIVPHNSSLVYGAPTAIVSTDIDAIMQQIASDFDKLKSR
jgi:hypothetical protein